MSAGTVLLFSSDTSAGTTIGSILSSMGVSLTFISDHQRATEELSTKTYDGVILECGRRARSADLVQLIRRSSSNKEATIVSFVEDDEGMARVLSEGANFAMHTPFTLPNLTSCLRIAVQSMQAKKRQARRLQVRLPALVETGGEERRAEVLDISENGLSFMSSATCQLGKEAVLRFRLPGHNRQILVKGSICWKENRHAGILFTSVGSHDKAVLLLWMAEPQTRM